MLFSSPSCLLGGLILSFPQIPRGGYGRMYFNLLEEFCSIFGAMSMTGFSSEENRNVRETPVPCPAERCFLHMCNPSPTTRWCSSQMQLGEFCGLLEYFLHLCPDAHLELLEPCRQWQDLESILILVKGVRVRRLGVNPDGSQVIYINYTNSGVHVCMVCVWEEVDWCVHPFQGRGQNREPT